jgi:hypothetical protein
MGLRSFPAPWAAVLSQALGNAAVGMIAFTVIESLPGAVERRRLSRRPKAWRTEIVGIDAHSPCCYGVARR